MNSLPKLLMIAGGALLVIGFLMQFIKLGRLPGDIVIKKRERYFLLSGRNLYNYKRAIVTGFLYHREIQVTPVPLPEQNQNRDIFYNRM